MISRKIYSGGEIRENSGLVRIGREYWRKIRRKRLGEGERARVKSKKLGQSVWD